MSEIFSKDIAFSRMRDVMRSHSKAIDAVILSGLPFWAKWINHDRIPRAIRGFAMRYILTWYDIELRQRVGSNTVEVYRSEMFVGRVEVEVIKTGKIGFNGYVKDPFAGKPFVINEGNVANVLEQMKKISAKLNPPIFLDNGSPFKQCSGPCARYMSNQPARMELTEEGPKYYCVECDAKMEPMFK